MTTTTRGQLEFQVTDLDAVIVYLAAQLLLHLTLPLQLILEPANFFLLQTGFQHIMEHIQHNSASWLTTICMIY